MSPEIAAWPICWRGRGGRLASDSADHYSDHVTRRVTATEAKAHLLSLLNDAENGQQIEITRHGRTVARIVPARGAPALEGSMIGTAWTTDPNDDLLSTGEDWVVQAD